ncbi:hypothetical protein [Oerskovia turbata]
MIDGDVGHGRTDEAEREDRWRWTVPVRAVLSAVGGVLVPLTVWSVVRAAQVPAVVPCGPETGGPPCPADAGALVAAAVLAGFGALFCGIVAAIMGATPSRLGRLFGILYLAGAALGMLLAEPWADAVVRVLASSFTNGAD